jgi:SAM-dependent methyltransferase
MEDVIDDSKRFFSNVLFEIALRDKLHMTTLTRNDVDESDFRRYLQLIIYDAFLRNSSTAEQVAKDYLQMIKDMRRETIYFEEHNEYSCKSEKEAYEKFYSQKGTMEYYLNALLVSQLLWSHHYEMLKFFNDTLEHWFEKCEKIRVLDIGAGHGLFSTIVKDTFVDYQKIDIVDISKSSLSFAKKTLGEDRIEYHNENLLNYISNYKYDLIILSEVIEHIDNPLDALKVCKLLLNHSGVLFITVPLNAPALDHIYLFREDYEVVEMIKKSGLKITEYRIEEVNGSKTKLIGAFCTR